MSGFEATYTSGGYSFIGSLDNVRSNNELLISSSNNLEYYGGAIEVNSDPSTLHYISTKETNDSTFFTYTNDKITSETSYYDTIVFIPYSNYPTMTKSDFEYDTAGNIIQVLLYYYSAPSWVLYSTSTWTYDNKPNPFQLGNDAIVLATSSNDQNGFPDLGFDGSEGGSILYAAAGVNNPLTETSTINLPSYGYGSSEQRVLTSTYIYNSNGTPAESTTVNSLTPTCSSVTTFTY